MKELFRDRTRWTKGVFARDKWGHSVWGSSDPRAYRFCLWGGINKINKVAPDGLFSTPKDRKALKGLVELLEDIIAQETHSPNEPDNLVTFNDRKSTKHKDILNLLDKAYKYEMGVIE